MFESKPNNKMEDFRLHNLWPKLQRCITPSILHIRFKVEDSLYVVMFLKPKHIAFL